jgi:hypothetical protein
MSEDDEVMRFEITDDDLNNEFNFDLKRPRMSKNQATYGIWAENSDEDEDPGKKIFRLTDILLLGIFLSICHFVNPYKIWFLFGLNSEVDWSCLVR